MNYNYALNCVGCPDHLVNDLALMVEEAEGITFDQFKEKVDPESLRIVSESLGYLEGSDLSLASDWAVRFKLGHFCGNECVFIVHSAVEYIFMDDAAAVYLLS